MIRCLLSHFSRLNISLSPAPLVPCMLQSLAVLVFLCWFRLNLLLVLESPGLDAALLMWSRQCRAEGRNCQKVIEELPEPGYLADSAMAEDAREVRCSLRSELACCQRGCLRCCQVGNLNLGLCWLLMTVRAACFKTVIKSLAVLYKGSVTLLVGYLFKSSSCSKIRQNIK